jgi:hypothetical protein
LTLPESALEVDGAERMVERLTATNHDLTSYKGIGKLSIEIPEGQQQTRIAWIGAEPNNLRIEVLVQPGGQPFASIASDGQWVYILAHQEGRLIKKSASRSSLKRLIAIPIGPQDVYLFLAGRIPILPHATARLYELSSSDIRSTKRQNPAKPRRILMLKSESSRYPNQKIYIEGDAVHQVEYFDNSGRFVYRMIFQAIQKVNGFIVPQEIYLSDDDQASALIEVERYWTDVAVVPSAFRLKAPQSK